MEEEDDGSVFESIKIDDMMKKVPTITKMSYE